MRLSIIHAAIFLAGCAIWLPSISAVEPRDGGSRQAEDPTAEVNWHLDYSEAMAIARREGKMLLTFFDSPTDELCRQFEKETLGDEQVRRKLQDYVCLKLPRDATISSDGKQITLLKHETFREMLGRPGVAIVDFAHQAPHLHGSVVSTFPLTEELYYTPRHMSVILDLPPGTLSQRTLIYAVRTHPESPASTSGRIDDFLLGEAKSHSRHQARIRLQGHHQWNTRFHRINAKLGGGLTASEVCAESWPGENLVEAAVECVRCWRLSQGHWSAVRALHPVYGYDMKRGGNGVWYATGIFGRG